MALRLRHGPWRLRAPGLRAGVGFVIGARSPLPPAGPQGRTRQRHVTSCQFERRLSWPALSAADQISSGSITRWPRRASATSTNHLSTIRLAHSSFLSRSFAKRSPSLPRQAVPVDYQARSTAVYFSRPRRCSALWFDHFPTAPDPAFSASLNHTSTLDPNVCPHRIRSCQVGAQDYSPPVRRTRPCRPRMAQVVPHLRKFALS